MNDEVDKWKWSVKELEGKEESWMEVVVVVVVVPV
jgi:hypothetical protein